MEVLTYILVFVVSSLFMALSLWLGLKVTKIEGTFAGMLTISAIATLLYFIPLVGGLLSLVTLYFLLHKWTTAELWPDSVILVAVAGLIRFVALFALTMLIMRLNGTTA